MADDLKKLLDHIVRHTVLRDELKSVEFDATADESGDVIESDKRDVVKREQDRADHLARAFGRGLALAYQRHTMGGVEVRLDDREAEQDAMAEALIRYLVSHDLATSRTEATDPMHYIYYVAVDWERLGDIARSAGIDLGRAVQKYAPS